jgi:hypothetical protein
MMFEKTIGSRAEVWHSKAKHTSGGLQKKHLLKNKHGRIVSKSKYLTAKKEKRLKKAGYTPVKGKFVVMRKSMKSVKGVKKTVKNKKSKKSKK